MSNGREANEAIRRRLRQIRTSKKLPMREVASRAGIALSSLGCMEGGFCRISLDNLSRILGALGADITAVWPAETTVPSSTSRPLYIRTIQQTRLGELVRLSGAEGAALFAVRPQKCSVLLYDNLSDFLLDRVVLHLQAGRRYEHGVWIERAEQDWGLHLFLKADACPDYVSQVARHYLVIWSNLFAGSLLGPDSNSRIADLQDRS